MIRREELIAFLEKSLEAKKYRDYCPNGLQVEGKEEISKVSFSVSATLDSIKQSCEWGSDCLITHHGIIWNYQGGKSITGPHYQRIKALLTYDINLISYHLPLDGHIEHGNASGLAKAIKLQNLEGFGEYKGNFTGVKGEFEKALNPLELKDSLERVLGKSILHANPKHDIKSLGIITGGANNEWIKAREQELDAYITGEISEYNWHDAIEAGVHYFACGHHATERFGVFSLMKLISQNFKVEVKFFDSENPV